MKIRNMHIHNYRSIRDLNMNVQDWMVLLGPNNHGKSNILSALEFFLSGSVKPTEDDFFAYRDEGELWVELQFDSLTDQEKHTFLKYVRSDGALKIRRFARINDSDEIEVGHRGYIAEPKIWWLKSSAFERLNSREKIQSEAITEPALLELLQQEGRVTKSRVEEFQSAYTQSHQNEIDYDEILEDNPLLGRANVASGLLPDFYLVPAIKELSDETRIKNTTLLGRLIQRTIQSMTDTDERFSDLQTRLSSLVKELNARDGQSRDAIYDIARLENDISAELKTWGVNVSIQVEPPEIEKLFELGTQLHIDDGHKTTAERKGHGLQRAVIFALLRTWAKALRIKPAGDSPTARRGSDSSIFVVEEPELFLHPHAQRQLASDLRDIAASPGNQVFICSHSTHFVNLDQYKSVVVVRKETAIAGTTVKQCPHDLFEGDDDEQKKNRFHMASWVNPERGELFFARKVVLVEGETEHAVFPFLASRMNCFDPTVTIVDCGSKHNLPLYIQILNAFDIKYLVIHDEDPLPPEIPSEWDEDKIREKRRTFGLNAHIVSIVNTAIGKVVVLSPDFEGIAGVSKTQGKKMGKAIAALEHFSTLPHTDVPPAFSEIVKELYC